MLFKYAIALVFGAVSVLATPLENLGHICGSDITSEAAAAAQALFPVGPLPPKEAGAQATTLNVYWHVLARDLTSAGGNIPDALIQESLRVLNQDYAAYGISFRLAFVDRTIRQNWSDWLTDGSPQEMQMKQTLKRGGPADLNFYSVNTIGGAPPGYLIDGFASFPWDYQTKPWDDGIVIARHALPGGPYPARGLGRTLAHETGHWLGLLHTFEGGCAAPGDYVDDTPFQQSPASGCPVGRDTCPQPGVDPIQNYMDYTDDACRTGITSGQYNRAAQAMAQFRGVRI